MLIQDNTQMTNAKDGYWFAGKLTSHPTTGVFDIDILSNKDWTRHIVSFFSAEGFNLEEPVAIIKEYQWVPNENTFRIHCTALKMNTGILVEATTIAIDYLIFISKTELITEADFVTQPLNVIEEDLLNLKI